MLLLFPLYKQNLVTMLDFQPQIWVIPTTSARKITDPLALFHVTSCSQHSVIQEPALLTKGDGRGHDAETAWMNTNSAEKILHKASPSFSYFQQGVLAGVPAGLLRGQDREIKGRYTWLQHSGVLWIFGMVPRGKQAHGKAPMGEEGCACLPPSSQVCTKQTLQ